jgi:hypothetical protein
MPSQCWRVLRYSAAVGRVGRITVGVGRARTTLDGTGLPPRGTIVLEVGFHVFGIGGLWAGPF